MSNGLDDLEYIQSGGPSKEELSKLDGVRVKIAKCEVVEDVGPVYNEKGQLIEGQEQKVKKIYLETVPFGKELIERDIVHREKYNLKDKDGKWVVSLHEKSKTGQFLAKYNLESFKDVVGTSVVLTKKTNPETKRSWLAISI